MGRSEAVEAFFAVFSRFLQLARRLQSPWHGSGWSGKPGSGRIKMTLSFNRLHQVALALVGALVTSSLFLSAAVGPVPVI